MIEKQIERSKILDDCKETITKDRVTHGKPESNFLSIAEQWSLYINQKYGAAICLTPEDVGWMMADLKKCRSYAGYNRDNPLDAIGYIAISSEVAKGVDNED